ncbi:MAG: histidine kinase dimerization/phospho-acceptor domain-containing protein, partial [Bacteroidia bacterium]
MQSLPLTPVNFNELLSDGHQMCRELIQNLPLAMYTCTAEGQITFYNKAAAALWGCEPAIGSDFRHGSWKMYKTDGTPLPADSSPMAIALKERKAVHSEEILMEGADGKRSYIRPHPQLLFDDNGALTGVLNMLVDVTMQWHYQQALAESEARHRSISAELEKEMEKRTEELKKKNEELERSNAELASFSYIASHDLQEPLRKIITFSDMLRMQNRQGDTVASEYLDRIINSSQRMKQLIEDVLNFSRLSSSERKFVK